MNNRVRYTVFIGLGLGVLAATVFFHLIGEWGALTPHSTVIFGPDEEATKRAYAKDAIIRQVLLGEKSLLAGAAAFRRLDDGASARFRPARQVFPDAASDEEAYCRCVIRSVGGQLAPKWRQPVTKRLQEELKSRLRDGTLHFDQADDSRLMEAEDDLAAPSAGL